MPAHSHQPAVFLPESTILAACVVGRGQTYGPAHGAGGGGGATCLVAGLRRVDRFFAARFLVERFLAGFRLADFFAPFFFGERFLAADFFAALRFFAMEFGSFPDSTQVIQVVFPLGANERGKTTSFR